MAAITIDLPFPPSTNKLWRYAKVGASFRVHNSPAYEAWIKNCDAYFYTQFSKQPQALENFTVRIVLDSRLRGRSDGDNRIKAVLDYCQRCGLIANDRGCDAGSWEWGEAEIGCRVTLEGHGLLRGERQ
jgi:Holliday junction resolvase RusA-like endonuclease